MAVLALVGAALTGCPEERPQETTVVPPADINGTEPVDVGEEVPEGQDAVPTNDNTIEVTLTEYEIDMLEEVYAGAATFVITNEGSELHNFEIEGQGIERMLEEPLEPGETGELDVDLQPGEYTVYCPVGDHAEEGMEMTLNVITMPEE
jgi:plastocyanin